jgi:hypothetical protein
MKIIPVLCQRCGAPLDVADESVRFVTCAHCSTPLEIVREATQSHSRILEQIQAATEDHGRRLEVIELQNDLERLDHDWIAKQNEEGNVDPKTGTVSNQNTGGCIALGILMAVGGAGGLISSVLRSPFSWWHLLLSLVAVLLGPLAIKVGMDEISRLKDSKSRYQAIRASLVNRLNLLRRK